MNTLHSTPGLGLDDVPSGPTILRIVLLNQLPRIDVIPFVKPLSEVLGKHLSNRPSRPSFLIQKVVNLSGAVCLELCQGKNGAEIGFKQAQDIGLFLVKAGGWPFGKEGHGRAHLMKGQSDHLLW